MTSQADKALKEIRECFHESVSTLDQGDYKAVLEELAADMEAHLSAFNDDGSESDD